MMNKQLEETHLTIVNVARLNPALNLAEILDLLDQIHNLASDEDGAADFTDLSDGETISLLRDVIYTAQETINEIEARQNTQRPILHFVEKQEKIG